MDGGRNGKSQLFLLLTRPETYIKLSSFDLFVLVRVEKDIRVMFCGRKKKEKKKTRF
jgi:hypothetical protein